MTFKKKSDSSYLPLDTNEKIVSVYYIYKTDIEDELDEKELFTKAFSLINENEDYDVICFKTNMWFGVTNKCFTCIYIDFNEEDVDITNAIKLVDNKKWKINVGFMFLDNVYNKIIITSSKDPNSLYTTSKKWKSKTASFKIIKL